jgi:hypothetical protein
MKQMLVARKPVVADRISGERAGGVAVTSKKEDLMAQGAFFRDPQQGAALARAMGGKSAAGVWDRLWNAKEDPADIAAMFVPGIGNALSGYAAAGSFSRGDIGGGLLNALGVIPGYGNIVGGTAKMISRVPKINKAGLAALKTMLAGVHRSDNFIGKLKDPDKVPFNAGRIEGNGTYFAQDAKTSAESYSQYGDTPYKTFLTPSAAMKIAASKGFSQAPARGLENKLVSSPEIQDLISQGFIGRKGQQSDQFTSWLHGIDRGVGLYPTKLSTLPKALGNSARLTKAEVTQKIADAIREMRVRKDNKNFTPVSKPVFTRG